jgi:hypothetical protein
VRRLALILPGCLCFGLLLPEKRPQIAAVEFFGQSTQIHPAFATTLDFILIQVVQGSFTPGSRFSHLANIGQVIQVLPDSRFDLPAQDNIPMPLDDVLKPHAADFFYGSGYLVGVTNHNLKQGH